MKELKKDFQRGSKNTTKIKKVSSEVPAEMDIFFRDEKQFLPKGLNFEDLTQEQKNKLKNQYRFDPFRPGIYQTLTGVNKMR